LGKQIEYFDSAFLGTELMMTTTFHLLPRALLPKIVHISHIWKSAKMQYIKGGRAKKKEVWENELSY